MPNTPTPKINLSGNGTKTATVSPPTIKTMAAPMGNADTYSTLSPNDEYPIIPYKEAESRSSSRFTDSTDELNITIYFIDLKPPAQSWEEPYVLTIRVEFKNNSSHGIVFKMPRRTGFEPVGNITALADNPINDLMLILKRKDGHLIEMMNSTIRMSQEYSTPFSANGGSLSDYIYHRPENFIEIKAGESFIQTYTCDIPVVVLEGNYSSFNTPSLRYKIPSGTYVLSGGYLNTAIGYYYPVEAVPNMDIVYLTSPNTQMVDLHAWVGTLAFSNKVEFTIP